MNRQQAARATWSYIMIKTSAATAEYLRGLTTKVKNGALSKSEAKRLAVQALQEVEEAEEAEDDAGKVQEQPEEKPAPAAPAVDPKTRILSLLTQFEEAIQGSLKKIEHDITGIVNETEGAAVPLGDFTIGNDPAHDGVRHKGSSAKITLAAGDKPAQVLITYNLKKSWTVDGVNLPVEASACHLPLRQDLLAACTEIRECTGSELSWKRSKRAPLEQLQRLESLAKASGDGKVQEIVGGRPSDDLAGSWRKWASAGQAYLLGSDWAENKNFDAVRRDM
jgi:hypothetical protein